MQLGGPPALINTRFARGVPDRDYRRGINWRVYDLTEPAVIADERRMCSFRIIAASSGRRGGG